MSTRDPVVPLTGNEELRTPVFTAGKLLPNELHTTKDQKRLFLVNEDNTEDNLVSGGKWLGTVANQAAMLALVSTSGFGCWSMDACYRTDTASVWLCLTNDGSDIGDWQNLDESVTLDDLTVNGANIASAATIDLDAATGDCVDVTGTTAITAITLAAGDQRTVRFTGALTLTHGASLVLPGAANITTAAGDFAIFRGYASSVVRCILYARADGTAVVSSGSDAASITYDNATSGLTATDVQAAIDEIAASLGGGGGGGDNSMQLIEEVTIGSPAASVVFSSIPQTFRHLKIVAVNALDSSPDWVGLRFNADTGSNYDWQVLRFTDTTPSAGASAAASFIVAGEAPNSTSVPGCWEGTIFEYASTTWHKIFRGNTATFYGTSASNFHPRETAGRWRSTSAITSLTIFSNVAGNFRAGSRFQLYGVGDSTGIYHGAKAVLTAVDAVSNSTRSLVSFDAASFDSNSFWSAGSPTKLTIPTGFGGRYEIGASYCWAVNSSGVRTIEIRKNDHSISASTAPLCAVDSPGLSGSYVNQSCLGVVDLAAGDYIELIALQTSGGSLNSAYDGNYSQPCALWLRKVG